MNNVIQFPIKERDLNEAYAAYLIKAIELNIMALKVLENAIEMRNELLGIEKYDIKTNNKNPDKPRPKGKK